MLVRVVMLMRDFGLHSTAAAPVWNLACGPSARDPTTLPPTMRTA